MSIFYKIFVSFLVFGMKIGALFSSKIRKGVEGRRKSFSIVQEKLKNQKVIWMHASSLGEYEQGLPVLEKLKKEYPDYKILVTFFSPSGYENVMLMLSAIFFLMKNGKLINSFLCLIQKSFLQ